jgi:hypothetical protein
MGTLRRQRGCEDRTWKFLRRFRLINHKNKRDFGTIKADRVATGRGRLDCAGQYGEFLFLFHPFSLVVPGSFWAFCTAFMGWDCISSGLGSKKSWNRSAGHVEGRAVPGKLNTVSSAFYRLSCVYLLAGGL